MKTLKHTGDELTVMVEVETPEGKNLILAHGPSYKYKNGWPIKLKKLSYYVLWGNSSHTEWMGKTKILSDNGNLVAHSTAFKKFHQMIKNSKSVTFKR